MNALTHDEILKLHAATVSAGLVASRTALLAGIDGRVIAGLPDAGAPGQQILLDLNALNAAGTLLDGSRPLAAWLANAVALCGLRQEAAVFQAELAKFRLVAGPAHGGTPKRADGQRAPKPASVRKLVAAVLRNDSELDAFCLDHCRAVYDRFSSGMDRVRKVNLLLERTTPTEVVARLREHDAQAVHEYEHLIEYD
jgi:hypothetical protein